MSTAETVPVETPAFLATSLIVIFWSGDHGFHLGDHGYWSKSSLLEATRRVPLIVRLPGAAGNGQACPGFVEFVDLVPPLGALAGFAVPSNLEGTSFAHSFDDAAV